MVAITRIPTRFVILILKPNMVALGELLAELTLGKERELSLDTVLAMIQIAMAAGVAGEIGVLGQ